MRKRSARPNPLSRKYYIAVASILKDAQQTTYASAYAAIEKITRELADYFQSDNARFDRQRFMHAAGSKRYNPGDNNDDFDEYVQLAVTDAAGIYAPQEFLSRYDVEGVDAEDVATVEAGPDEEWYWEAWSNIEDNGYVMENDIKWQIYQSGDIWLVREDAPDEVWEGLSY